MGMASSITPSQSCYTSLSKTAKEIRLLHLWPVLHPHDGKLQCTLSPAVLGSSPSDTPSYEALSYMWGEPDDLGIQIWVNGSLFAVRENLWHALQVLRLKERGEDTGLWIDALCINQDDFGERGHQVGFMGEIFQRAKRVLVWLGCPDYALDFELRKDSCCFTGRSVSTTFPLNNMEKFANRPLMEYGSEWMHASISKQPKFWEELAAIFELPYWSRLWIIQEIILARKLSLLWGVDMCDWNSFSGFHLTLKSYLGSANSLSTPVTPTAYSVSSNFATTLNTYRESWRYESRSFTGVLMLGLHTFCQDPRDKVFGLLGLEQRYSGAPLDLEKYKSLIDYSTTLVEVWRSVILLSQSEPKSETSTIRFSQDLLKSILGPVSPVSAPHELELPSGFGSDERSVILQGLVLGIDIIWRIRPDEICVTRTGVIESINGSKNTSQPLSMHRESFQQILMERWKSGIIDLWTVDHETLMTPIFHKPSLDPDFTTDSWRTSAVEFPKLTSSLDFMTRDEFVGVQAQLFADEQKKEKEKYADFCLFEYLHSDVACIGIAPNFIRLDDSVCRFEKSDVAAIVRLQTDDTYTVVCRALITPLTSSVHFKERKVSAGSWSPPEFPSFQPMETTSRKTELRVTERELLELTRPLKPRSYG